MSSVLIGEEQLVAQVLWQGDEGEILSVVLSDGTRMWSGTDMTGGKALGQKGVDIALRKQHAIACLEPPNGIPVRDPHRL